jgi:hypothetical protein
MKYWKQVHLHLHQPFSRCHLPLNHILASLLMLKTSLYLLLLMSTFTISADLLEPLLTCLQLTEHRVRRQNQEHPLIPPRAIPSLQMRTRLLHRLYFPRQQNCSISTARVLSNALSYQQDRHCLICVWYTRNGCADMPVR